VTAIALVAQLDRASDFESEGREFESLRARHFTIFAHSLDRDIKFDTRRPRCGTIVGTAALAEINDADESERTQYCVVETATAAYVGDTQRDMFQHSVLSGTRTLFG
jgi:hypothetical protein